MEKPINSKCRQPPWPRTIRRMLIVLVVGIPVSLLLVLALYWGDSGAGSRFVEQIAAASRPRIQARLSAEFGHSWRSTRGRTVHPVPMTKSAQTDGRSDGVKLREPMMLPPPTVVGWQIWDKLLEMLRSTRYPSGISSRNLAVEVHHHHQPTSVEHVRGLLRENEVAYFIKACKKFNGRAVQVYNSWAKSVEHVYFSTDKHLDGIPRGKQLITSLASRETDAFLEVVRKAKGDPVYHAASCAVTMFNLALLLSDIESTRDIKWLVLLDDDTFVLTKNLLEYLSVFPSSGNWYLGLSNAELPYVRIPFADRKAFLPITATAPGVVYSRGLLNKLRRRTGSPHGSAQLEIANQTYALEICRRSAYKDDVAVGFLAMILQNATFVARPDLRGYNDKTMADPVHLKPLSVHTQLQTYHADEKHIFQDLMRKYSLN